MCTIALFKTDSAAIRIIVFNLKLQWAACSRIHLAETEEGEEEEEGLDWT